MKRIVIAYIFFLFSIILKGQVTATVTVTVYPPTKAHTNDQPLITADGSRIDLRKLKEGKIKWCGVSRDLLKRFPLGSKIYIQGFGVYEVHDKTNRRFRNLVDILIHPDDERVLKTNVKIIKVI